MSDATPISDSLEVRWFLRDGHDALPALRAWFAQVPEEPPRADHYLRTGRADLGVKLRTSEAQAARIETKFLVAAHGEHDLGHGTQGALESWRKVSLPVEEAPARDDSEWITLQKRRRLRTYTLDGTAAFETHGQARAGCGVELTQVEVAGRPAASTWTFGLEAFGPEPARAPALHAACTALAAEGLIARLSIDDSYGYARWLRDLSEDGPGT